jgi:hypothetical protein
VRIDVKVRQWMMRGRRRRRRRRWRRFVGIGVAGKATMDEPLHAVNLLYSSLRFRFHQLFLFLIHVQMHILFFHRWRDLGIDIAESSEGRSSDFELLFPTIYIFGFPKVSLETLNPNS